MNKTYHTGEKIYLKCPTYERDIIEEYIIVQTSANKVCFVDTIRWNRWKDPIKVNDSMVITQREMNDIIGEFAVLVPQQEYEEYLIRYFDYLFL